MPEYHLILLENMNEQKAHGEKKNCNSTFVIIAFTILSQFNIFLG
jgi:hypothetical protein